MFSIFYRFFKTGIFVPDTRIRQQSFKKIQAAGEHVWFADFKTRYAQVTLTCAKKWQRMVPHLLLSKFYINNPHTLPQYPNWSRRIESAFENLLIVSQILIQEFGLDTVFFLFFPVSILCIIIISSLYEIWVAWLRSKEYIYIYVCVCVCVCVRVCGVGGWILTSTYNIIHMLLRKQQLFCKVFIR